MDARKVAARFAAYTWYEQTAGTQSPEKANRFARQNWEAFLPQAHEGLGRLLLQIARGQPRRLHRRERPGKRSLATA